MSLFGFKAYSSVSTDGLWRLHQHYNFSLQFSHYWLHSGFWGKPGPAESNVPSNTVYAEWSCALWWQSIYTWEEGYWYWDRSNIAANEGLRPGKLEKRWWTVEEIDEGLTIKNFWATKKKKNCREHNSNLFSTGASLKRTGTEMARDARESFRYVGISK